LMIVQVHAVPKSVSQCSQHHICLPSIVTLGGQPAQMLAWSCGL